MSKRKHPLNRWSNLSIRNNSQDDPYSKSSTPKNASSFTKSTVCPTNLAFHYHHHNCTISSLLHTDSPVTSFIFLIASKVSSKAYNPAAVVTGYRHPLGGRLQLQLFARARGCENASHLFVTMSCKKLRIAWGHRNASFRGFCQLQP